VEKNIKDDEIDLKELVGGVWRIRSWIVGGSLLAVAVAVSVLAFQHLTQIHRGDAVAYVELTGISNGTYPSGAAFSPSHLTGSEVLSDIRQRLDLDLDLPLSTALTAEFGHPDLPSLRRERDAAIQTARAEEASASDIGTIRADYNERIESLRKNTLRLGLNLSALDISDSTAQILLETVPVSWQHVFGERFRIFLPDTVTAFGQVDIDDLGTFRGGIAADRYLQEARQTLNALMNDSRAQMLTSPDGSTPRELISRIDQFRQLFFDPFFASQIMAVEDPLNRGFIQDLESERREISELIAEINQTVDSVSNLRSRREPAISASERLSNNMDQPSLTLGDSGLESIIELAQTSGMQDYLTELFERRYALVRELAELDTRISRFSDAERLRPAEGSAEDLSSAVEARLLGLQPQVSGLLETAQRQLRGQTGRLYEFMEPASVRVQAPETSRAGLVVALSAILGAMLGLFVGLLRTVLRRADG